MPCPKLGLGKFDHRPIQCGFQVASWDTARLDSDWEILKSPASNEHFGSG